MKLRVAGTLAVALLSLAACEGGPVADEAAASAVDAAATDAVERVAAPDAPAPAVAAEAGAPAFAAIYPGAEVVQAGAGQAETASGRMVTFTTEDTPDAVISFYKARAEAAGLAPVMAMSQGDTRAYGAAESGAGGDSLSVVASPDADVTSVQLSWNDAR